MKCRCFTCNQDKLLAWINVCEKLQLSEERGIHPCEVLCHKITKPSLASPIATHTLSYSHPLVLLHNNSTIVALKKKIESCQALPWQSRIRHSSAPLQSFTSVYYQPRTGSNQVLKVKLPTQEIALDDSNQ